MLQTVTNETPAYPWSHLLDQEPISTGVPAANGGMGVVVPRQRADTLHPVSPAVAPVTSTETSAPTPVAKAEPNPAQEKPDAAATDALEVEPDLPEVVIAPTEAELKRIIASGIYVGTMANDRMVYYHRGWPTETKAEKLRVALAAEAETTSQATDPSEVAPPPEPILAASATETAPAPRALTVYEERRANLTPEQCVLTYVEELIELSRDPNRSHYFAVFDRYPNLVPMRANDKGASLGREYLDRLIEITNGATSDWSLKTVPKNPQSYVLGYAHRLLDLTPEQIQTFMDYDGFPGLVNSAAQTAGLQDARYVERILGVTCNNRHKRA